MRVWGAFGEVWDPLGAQKEMVWDLGAISPFRPSPFWPNFFIVFWTLTPKSAISCDFDRFFNDLDLYRFFIFLGSKSNRESVVLVDGESLRNIVNNEVS